MPRSVPSIKLRSGLNTDVFYSAIHTVSLPHEAPHRHPVPTSTDLAYNAALLAPIRRCRRASRRRARRRSPSTPPPARPPTSSTPARPSSSPAAQPTSTRKSTARTPSPSAPPPTPPAKTSTSSSSRTPTISTSPSSPSASASRSLNVWRGGTLVQDLAPLPVNHPAGRTVAIAHTAAIAPDSLLGTLIPPEEAPEQDGFLRLPINSSHHQAIGIPGDGLRVSARCPQDAVIEAVEGGQATEDATAHFVLGVQWHPERSYDISPASQALFDRFVAEAAAWNPRPVHTSVAS